MTLPRGPEGDKPIRVDISEDKAEFAMNDNSPEALFRREITGLPYGERVKRMRTMLGSNPDFARDSRNLRYLRASVTGEKIDDDPIIVGPPGDGVFS